MPVAWSIAVYLSQPRYRALHGGVTTTPIILAFDVKVAEIHGQ